MNRLIFDGRLGADSELRYDTQGKARCTFRVASDIGYGDNKHTNWFSCSLWGKRGEKLSEYLTKGKKVLIDGRLKITDKQDNNGQDRRYINVSVDEVELLGDGSGGGQSAGPGGFSQDKPAQPAATRQQDDDGFDDSIPF